MAILINDNYSLAAIKPFDARYLNISTPWISVAAVNTGIPAYRYTGLTVNILGVEYWYANGITDTDLVIKTNGVEKNIASVGQIIYRNSTQLTGCSNMYYCDALPSLTIGANNTANGANSISVGGLSNAVTSVCSAIIAGQSNCIGSGNIGSAIIGGSGIILTASTNCCVVAVPNLSIWCTPSGSGNLLTWDSTSKKVGVTNISSSGGITGATNGLCKYDANNVCLGGSLITSTSIIGNEALCLGTNANKLGSLDLWSFDDTCMHSRCLLMSSSGATYTDLRAVTKKGIQYAIDYSLTYDSRSLVDKGYVDSVAVGLTVHANVVAATTIEILPLSGSPKTIDGVSLVTGQRVLVKNQSNGVTNGIYVVSGTTWGRASDYDGTPSGEVANGDLIPVTSGLTLNNSLWALTTPNPITIGVTSLSFIQFSTVIDIQAGDGIAISQVGGVHTACVLLPGGGSPACGLAISNSGLCVDSNIAGCALTYSAGVLCVNAASCNTVPAIPVGFNTAECLVVAYSDIRNVANAITGATNGLTSTNCVVKLGGALSETTTISGAQSLRVNTCYFNVTGTTGLCLSTGCGVITDTGNKGGLQYAASYDPYVVPLSIPNAAWVTGKTSTSGIQTACNGLTKNGTNVVLGGALTGNTSITGAYTLNLCSGAKLNTTCGYQISGTTIFDVSRKSLSNINIGQSAGNSTGTGTNNTAIGFEALRDNTTGSNNIVNGHEAHQKNTIGCNNIAISQKALQNNISGCNNIAIGHEALYSNQIGSNNIGLGCFAGYSNVNGSGSTFIGTCAGFSETTSNKLYLANTDTNRPLIYGEFPNTCAVIHGAFKTSGATSLLVAPTTGVITDSVLVWNSGDKLIKTVAGASLGDKNNIYSKSAVTTSVTLTSGSSFVILVSAATTTTIILPTTPISGQVFKIKDVCGNALVNNIIVDAGSGRVIDNARCGLINTDYGALELMYGVTDKWFSLAFVN